jgi:hypothetical protein
MDIQSIHPFVIFFAAITTNNILLTNFLGMCSFLAVSKDLKSSLGLGGAVIFVSTFTAPLNWLVYYKLLVPYGLEYLQYIAFIIVVAAFVQIIEMIIERLSTGLYLTLGHSWRGPVSDNSPVYPDSVYSLRFGLWHWVGISNRRFGRYSKQNGKEIQGHS